MADSDMASKLGQCLLVEDLGDQSHLFVPLDLRPVGHHDPRRLLPPVLQGKQAVESQLGDMLPRRKNAEDAALLARRVVVLPGRWA